MAATLCITKEEILTQLLAYGYRGQIVSIQHLSALQAGIESPRRNGLLSEEFYQNWLMGHQFSLPEAMPGTRSLIVVAVPQPPTRITFTLKSRPLYTLVPPTYLHAGRINQQVKETLHNIFNGTGYGVIQAFLPVKLLAVCSGLSSYGRNNITYIEGMGSFYRLAAFYTDFPCSEGQWREPCTMSACDHCTACLKKCPTGAISPDRFLLYAERCLPYHNEKPGNIPFADWIDPGWHNCLVGCLSCQVVCPQNRFLSIPSNTGPASLKRKQSY